MLHHKGPTSSLAISPQNHAALLVPSLLQPESQRSSASTLIAMAAVESPAPATEPAATLPDYVTNPNAVLNDVKSNWRYGRPPDYSKTRAVYEQSKWIRLFPFRQPGHEMRAAMRGKRLHIAGCHGP